MSFPIPNQPFLVIAAAMLVNKGKQPLQLGVTCGKSPEAFNLVAVAFGGASRKQTFNILRDIELCPSSCIRTPVYGEPELRQENIDTRKVEITEMQVPVGYALEPGHQVSGLRITAHKQNGHLEAGEQMPLILHLAEILHIFYTYYKHIARDTEILPIGYEGKGSAHRPEQNPGPAAVLVRRTKLNGQRLIHINRKTRTGPDGAQLRIAESLHQFGPRTEG